MISALNSPSASQSVYTDLAGLNSISQIGRENTPEGLRKVAEQFESIFINMMLKGMRQSNSSLFENNYLSSNEMQFHQENLDNQLSMHMAGAGGIGLADALYRQMAGQYNVADAAPTATVAELPPRRDFQVRRKATAAEVPGATSMGAASVQAQPGKAVSASVPSQKISSPQDFVRQLMPIARKIAKHLGLDPRMLLAQSALETGWGASIPSRQDGSNSHNLFGVKADGRWKGDRVSTTTLEFRAGVMQQEKASFRSYPSYEDSFSDYAQFLQTNPRYAQALQHTDDPHQFVRQLQEAGYATDPDYADKVSAVMNSPLMKTALEHDATSSRGEPR